MILELSVDECQLISILLSMNDKYFTNAPMNNVISNHSTTVLLQNIVKFKKGNEIIGKLDATIDFKDLSPELHQSALQLLQQMPVCLYTAVDEPANDLERPRAPEPDRVPTLWQRIKGWFPDGK